MNCLKPLLGSSIVLLLAGCSSFWNMGGETRSGVSSSLVDYLYPAGEIPPNLQDSIPYLELPLRVGIAFGNDQDRAPGEAQGRVHGSKLHRAHRGHSRHLLAIQ